ncbi:unnamed protein product [Rotaria magnacalcarata]
MGISYSSVTAIFRSGKHKTEPRNVIIGRRDLNTVWYPQNVICNQKYSIITFIPLVLFEQFSVFFNLYFLAMACTQFVPSLRINYLYTYWAPLCFITFVSMLREGYEDIKRAYRDKEINSQRYTLLTENGRTEEILSSEIEVSDIIILQKNQRVPADILLLQTLDKSGTCFIRTDQLDGETDWKLRIAAPISGTVIATGEVIGCVIYTGTDTRMVMNTNKPRYKFGLVDKEINTFAKLLFLGSAALALVMVILKGFHGPWYRYFIRFLLLFSYMIPISLRVNLDLGKLAYSWFIQQDKNIPGSVVRTSTIPEELGRIGYLLTDKTGTLTQNVMIFKRLYVGSGSYTIENRGQISKLLKQEYAKPTLAQYESQESLASSALPFGRKRKIVKTTEALRVTEAIKALALCHNVTPTVEQSTSALVDTSAKYDNEYHSTSDTPRTSVTSLNTTLGSDVFELLSTRAISYQASSPDEIAIVDWTEQIGLTLIHRSLKSMTLKLNSTEQLFDYEILQLFPFTPETKRMGIIVRDENTNEIIFYLKGADTVMQNLVQYNDWLQEESANMAREGLRTLVIAKKQLTQEKYQAFEQNITKARLQTINRTRCVREVIETLECDMELLGVTGVEDKLQLDVRQTLESLHNGGIKIWMLTGDKLETATCIAKSSKLIRRNDDIYIIQQVATREECLQELNIFKRKIGACLVITGDALQICLSFYEKDLMESIIESPSVVVCRCSPTQKAIVVDLLKKYRNKKVRVCAIGDGGNDVSMIQSAYVGIGIVGKKGKQASLAAAFSINPFSYLTRLLFVHGRDSYKRTASLSQFIIHRGVIITVIQAIFSFTAISLYQGFLLVDYGTVYTMFPVFSLVLDQDVPADIALLYPELYKELAKGRIYQGSVIMYVGLILFDADFIHVVSITFTALILTELLMVALAIQIWHILMVVGEFLSFTCYVLSIVIFQSHFDIRFLESWSFIWRVVAITAISCLPLYILKYMQTKFKPPIHEKLTQYATLK